jgi:hypothetical protein
MGGAWVGIFATAHNSSFNGKGKVRAVFDNLNFKPTAIYQIGSP